jgi:hypothetical protein
MADYADSSTVLVAEADCTAEGKPVCDANGVQGFPTIKYGDPNDLQDYQGGRTLDDLQTFAKENLKPTCGPANLDLCDDEKKTEITALQALSADDLDSKIKEKEEELAAAETNFKDEVALLQKKYESLTKDKDAALKAVKDSGLGLMKSVKAAAGSAAKEEL